MVGLRTIQLFVQVHRHWVEFTLVRRRYESHKCHNKPQIEIGTGVWMTSCPEAMGWEFGYFEKHVSWVLDSSRVGSLLGASPVEFYCRPVELGTRLGSVQLGVDFGHVESWSWVKTMVLRSWSLSMELCRSLPTEILKTTRCGERFSFVSIEWLRIVSLSSCRRTEFRSQEVSKRSNLNNGVACVFESACVFAYL